MKTILVWSWNEILTIKIDNLSVRLSDVKLVLTFWFCCKKILTFNKRKNFWTVLWPPRSEAAPSQVLQFNVYRKNSFASIEVISQEVNCLVFVTLALLGEPGSHDEMIAATREARRKLQIRYLYNVIPKMQAVSPIS